jgi:hypothetical protein
MKANFQALPHTFLPDPEFVKRVDANSNLAELRELSSSDDRIVVATT